MNFADVARDIAPIKKKVKAAQDSLKSKKDLNVKTALDSVLEMLGDMAEAAKAEHKLRSRLIAAYRDGASAEQLLAMAKGEEAVAEAA